MDFILTYVEFYYYFGMGQAFATSDKKEFETNLKWYAVHVIIEAFLQMSEMFW